MLRRVVMLLVGMVARLPIMLGMLWTMLNQAVRVSTKWLWAMSPEHMGDIIVVSTVLIAIPPPIALVTGVSMLLGEEDTSVIMPVARVEERHAHRALLAL
jgi:hypothetical protein